MVFISREALDDKLRKARNEGIKAEKDVSRRTIKALEVKAVEVEDKLEKANAELKVLRADRDRARNILREEMVQADTRAMLETRTELADQREKRLNEREKLLDSKEDGKYKEGYSDGVVDGVRRINEITQGDRDNLAKIAMVAAASHTNIETIKEVNNEFRLTEGSQNKKAK